MITRTHFLAWPPSSQDDSEFAMILDDDIQLPTGWISNQIRASAVRLDKSTPPCYCFRCFFSIPVLF